MYHTYQAALTDQDYAFSISSALKSGNEDDVQFDSWKNSAYSLNTTDARPNTDNHKNEEEDAWIKS